MCLFISFLYVKYTHFISYIFTSAYRFTRIYCTYIEYVIQGKFYNLKFEEKRVSFDVMNDNMIILLDKGKYNSLHIFILCKKYMQYNIMRFFFHFKCKPKKVES